VAYGEALTEAGRLAEAEVQFRAGIQAAPDDPNAHVRLGAVLAQQGRLDEALPHLERSVALRPDDPDAHRFLGDIHAMRGREAAAVRHLERSLAMVPRDVRVLARLAAILVSAQDPSVRNAPRARELAEQAVRLTAGRHPGVLEILSAAQAATGAFVEAAATARRGAAVARAMGDAAGVEALEQRAAAYDRAAREGSR
jgi:tetratricopeptide (TPR) repeat protein